MQNFQLVPNAKSFKVCLPNVKGRRSCSNGGRNYFKGCDLNKLFNVLVVGAYVFSSALIVYSLLLFNLMLVAKPAVASQISQPVAVLEVPVLSNLPNLKTVWYETVFFIDMVGSSIGTPLSGAIDLYRRGLTAVFLATGKALSQIPQILTSPPAFARVNSS